MIKTKTKVTGFKTIRALFYCSILVEDMWGIEDEISKLIIGLYDETSGSPLPDIKDIAKECLDIWDLMFEKQNGPIRNIEIFL